jgi:hypothetical protein
MAFAYKSLLRYSPFFQLLLRDLMVFVFQSKKDAHAILNSRWYWGSLMVLLKNWSPFFDLGTKKTPIQAIWLKLPSLHLKFWSWYVFMAIGNYIGSFVQEDFSFYTLSICIIARILVEVDLRDGLAKDIMIKHK